MTQRPTKARGDNSLEILTRSRNLLETLPKLFEGDYKAIFQRQVAMPEEFQLNFRLNSLTPVVLANRKRFYPMTFRLVYDYSELENIVIRTSVTPAPKALPVATGQTADDRELANRRALAQTEARATAEGAELERQQQANEEINTTAATEAGLKAEDQAGLDFNKKNPPLPTLERQDTVQIDSIDRTRVGPPVVTDPFVLWVNPESLQFNSEKVISDAFTRRGHINEYWGDRQLQLSARGRTPAFYTHETGLTRVNRSRSGAYANLMTLAAIYRNNGYQYDREDRRRIIRVGAVMITYDGVEYDGRFESFRISESDVAPFLLEYEFDFLARNTRRLPLTIGAQAVITVNR